MFSRCRCQFRGRHRPKAGWYFNYLSGNSLACAMSRVHPHHKRTPNSALVPPSFAPSGAADLGDRGRSTTRERAERDRDRQSDCATKSTALLDLVKWPDSFGTQEHVFSTCCTNSPAEAASRSPRSNFFFFFFFFALYSTSYRPSIHYQKDALTGHRPTWKMGANGGKKGKAGAEADLEGADRPFSMFSDLTVAAAGGQARASGSQGRDPQSDERRAQGLSGDGTRASRRRLWRSRRNTRRW